jgi:hypothetical protein
MLATACQAIAQVVICTTPPLPLFYAVHALFGAGWALIFASVNSYAVTLPRANEKLGMLHAAYGIGSLVIPLASTPFSAHIRFFYFYGVSLGLTLLNAMGLFFSFRRKDGELRKDKRVKSQVADQAEDKHVEHGSMYAMPQVWICSILYFIFVVCGI